jgi:hypothetical protein
MSTVSLTNLSLSTTSPSPVTNLQTYFKERYPEIQQLGKDLQSGNLAAAQQDYNKLEALGNNVLHKDNPFLRSDRGSDFNAIGSALQSGDIGGAQQAYAALESTFLHKPASTASPAAATAPAASGTPGSGVNVIG